jgi:hypothetical protein
LDQEEIGGDSDLKTIVKVIEQKVEGLEEVVEQMEILEIEKVVLIIVRE